MRKATLLLLIIIFSVNGFSQPAIQWQKCFGGTEEDYAQNIKQTADGGYVFTGKTLSNNGDVSGNHSIGPQKNDIWVVKTDVTGNIQWQKCLGGTDDERSYEVEQTLDLGFVIASYAFSNDGDVTGIHGTVDSDAWIIKLDSSGNIQWKKCYGGSGREEAFSIKQTSDGGFIVSGRTSSLLNDGDVSGWIGGSDFWLIKISSTGSLQWQKCLGGSGVEYGYSIDLTSDGGFIATGSTSSNDHDVSGNHGGLDMWIVKIDSSGNIQWQKCLGGTADDEGYSIKQTSDGGYVAAGYTLSNDGDVIGHHSDKDYWIIKLDINGNLLWQKCFGGSSEDKGASINETTDGGLIVAGYTLSNDGDVTGFLGGADFWVLKLNQSGNILWQKCLGGTGGDASMSIQQTSDGGFICSGISASTDGDVTGLHGTNFDAWVVKLAPDVGIEENNAPQINILPNPATSELTIENAELKIKEIEVYSSFGEKIYLDKFELGNRPHLTIGVADFAPGIYFITVTDQAGNRVTKKVVRL